MKTSTLKPLDQNLLQIEVRSEFFRNDLSGAVRTFQQAPLASIEIEIESLKLKLRKGQVIVIERPISLRGIVLPSKTNARGQTPSPVAFASMLKYLQRSKNGSQFRELAPYSDRGHVFALDLGGPNTPYNIIPQWSGFQARGDWRKIETSIKKDATLLMEKGNSLYYEIELGYLTLSRADLQQRVVSLFDFETNPASESKIKKCLQVCGTPVQYSFYTYPCNLQLKKPRNHGFSIAYVKYLYEVSQLLYQEGPCQPSLSQRKAAQKAVARGYGTQKVALSNFLNYDARLFGSHNAAADFCKQGTFLLSALTEADL